jgi:hypothetical protein
VTPFDATALLVMLLAFYPIVSGAELARARRERPEYFAGGALVGSKGDKLQLPDGRVFDLIYAAGGLAGAQRWQVITAGPSVDDPFPLEPGPLTPIDLETVPPAPAPGPSFETLVGGELATLAGADAALGAARSVLVEGAAAADLVAADGAQLDDAGATIDEIGRTRSAEALATIIGSTDGLGTAIDVTDNEYDQAPPQPQIPHEPDIPAGGTPDDGSGGEPGRENPQPKPHPGDDDTTHRGGENE